MTVLSDYVSGMISLTNGSVDFTGTGTGWLLAGFKEGDTIIDITGATEFMGVIASIDTNAGGKLTKPWEGPTLVDAPYRMRYQPDGSRVSAQARNLIELLGDGTLVSLAGLTGPGVIELLAGGGAQVVPKSDLVSGADYDVQVSDLAGRAVYDGQAAGFAVLVSDVGDGRAAIYSKVSNASGDWSAPAYVTGPVGPEADVTVGPTTTLPPGSAATVAPTPTPGGVQLDFGIPAGEGFYWEGPYNPANAYDKDSVVQQNGSTFIALQAVPAGEAPSNASPPVDTPYWAVLAAKGQDGEIDGVTPFWQSRILNDADAAAARAGLELIKQANPTDGTAGRLLSVGAFGVGLTAQIVGPDLAAARPSGLYYCNTPSNGPVSSNGWLVVYDLTADYQYQQYYLIDGTIYDNVRNAGTWRGWRRLKPEYGSNANGEYIRLPDGTQICSGRHTRSSVAVTGTGTTSGVFYEASSQTVTFPAAFLTGTVPKFVHSETAGNIMWTTGASPITNTQGRFLVVAASSEPSRASDVNWIATGRWF